MNGEVGFDVGGVVVIVAGFAGGRDVELVGEFVEAVEGLCVGRAAGSRVDAKVGDNVTSGKVDADVGLVVNFAF